MPPPFAVTGASGFIGSWVVKLLLERGETVHATVRSLTDKSKVEHLQAIANESKSTLRLFEAELHDAEGYRKAFDTCQVVLHIASPFKVQGVNNPVKDIVEPAVSGTRNVLDAVSRSASVKRVVVTSSVAAIHCDAADYPEQALNESLWNETASETYQPYSYSKTQAERLAWQMAETQSQWSLVTINPSFVLGPSLSNRVDATSVDLMLQMVDGRAKRGLPDLRLGVVDVRDVAMAHVLAATLPDAQGRHIVSKQVVGLPEIAERLRGIYADRYPIPQSTVPKALMYVFGPLMGFSIRYVKRNVGVPFSIDNGKSTQALGLNYRPLEQTLKDSIDQLESMGLISANRKSHG